MKKWILSILIIALLIGGGWYGSTQFKSKSSSEKKSENSKNPTLTSVKRDRIIDQITVSGEITTDSRNVIEVKPEVSGKIKKIYPVLGDEIKAGDLLIELDDRDLLTEKETAQRDIDGNELSLNKAKRLYERSDKLFQKKLVSLQDFENSKTDYEIAQNNFEKAQSRLRSVIDKIEKTKIRSPMNGTIITLPVVSGQVVVGAGSVNAGSLLMTIANLSKMVIQCHMNQVDIGYVSENQTITFRVDSIRKDHLKGKVDIIAPTATSRNNVKGYGVTIQIQDLDPLIRPGMTADVTFQRKIIENALVLPLQVIFNEDSGEKVVYLPRGEKQEPEKRIITTGVVTLDNVEITSGLTEGDQVLMSRPRPPKS